MIDLFMIHTATVRTYAGAGPSGPVYADAVEVPCFLQDGLELVPESGGHQWVNKTTLYAQLDAADVLTVSSQVTVNGRSMVVTGAHPNDGGNLIPDVTHLQVDVS